MFIYDIKYLNIRNKNIFKMKKVMGSPLKLTTHRNDYGKRFKRKPAEKL